MDQADTYAKGVHNLQKACQKRPASPHPTFSKPDGSLIYRPLNFKETIQVRVIDYNTVKDEDGNDRDLEDRLRFFNHWIDSCTGMAYKGGTTRFKVVPTCEELITIKNNFNDTFLPIEYDAIVGVELDTTAGKYDESLTKKEVMNHQAWLAAVNEDKELLKEYRNIVFDQLKAKYSRDTGMGFYFANVGEEDQLRALFVYNLNYYSNASGDYDLSNSGSFLHVASSGSAVGASRKNKMEKISVLLEQAEEQWRDEVSNNHPLWSNIPVIKEGKQGHGSDWDFSTDLKQIFALIFNDESLRQNSLS